MTEASDPQRAYVEFAFTAAVTKLCRLSTVVERAQYDAPHPHLNLFPKLQGRIETELKQLFDLGIGRLLRSDPSEEDLRSVCATLTSFFRRVPTLHREVVYWISGPWAPLEIQIVLLRSVHEALGAPIAEQLVNLSPIVAQTGMYDFLSDYKSGEELGTSDPKKSTQVWALPYAEVQNPLAWVMLFHEVAHTLIKLSDVVTEAMEAFRQRIPKQHTRLVSRLVTEFLADRIATDIAGPAYYSALTTFILLERHSEDRGYTGAREGYPGARERVTSVANHLANHLGLPLDHSGDRDMSAAASVALLFQGRCELDDDIRKVAVDPTNSWLSECEAWTEILQYAYALVVRQFNGSPFGVIQRQSRELGEELGRGTPVGASSRPGARLAAHTLISKASLRESKREILMAELEELPNSPRAVLNAGWIAEFSTWRKDLTKLVVGTKQDPVVLVRTLKTILRTHDDLLVKSLDSLLLHTELLDAITSAREEL